MRRQEARAQFGVGLTMAVIGHTHHARIAVYEGGNGEFYRGPAGSRLSVLSPGEEGSF